MQEFKQYGHYMQPRIHKMVQEVRLLSCQPGAALLWCQCLHGRLRVAGLASVGAGRWRHA